MSTKFSILERNSQVSGLGRQKLLVCVITLIGLLFFPSTTFAYIDLGSGSYLLQVALAMLFGWLIAARQKWQKIKGFFNRLKSRKRNGQG